MEDKLKSKITSELENRTLDKIIKPNQSSEDDLMDTLFGDSFYTEDFYNSLMEQLEQQEEAAQNTEGADDGIHLLIRIWKALIARIYLRLRERSLKLMN